MKRPQLGVLTIAAVAALGFATSAIPNSGNRPTFVTETIDDTFLLTNTSNVCGFPVYEHDTGTLKTMITTFSDGSVRFIQHVEADFIFTFFSTDPAHPGEVTVRPAGPFMETDNPDGSVTLRSIGSGGHVNVPGQGIIFASMGITEVEIDASGNVTRIQRGNFSDTHAGICPLL